MTTFNPSLKEVRRAEKRKDGMRFSIRTKITFWVGFCIALFALILIGYSVITLRQMSIDNATEEARTLADAQAGLVQNQLNLPLFTARAMAQFLSTTKDPGNPISLSRDQVNGMLRTLLINNPSFLGTYTLWEPNEFDGEDPTYAGAVAHDETGRFIPYWVRGDDGIIHVEALAQYETPGVGDWYLLPRSTKREVTLAPLIYPIQGKDVVMASFVVPIIQNNKFYGIAGVDAPIGFVQHIVDNVNLYEGTTNAVLFSDTGTLIAVRQQPELTNQPASLVYPDFDKIQPTLGSAFTRLSPDGKYLQIFSPIDIGDTGTQWVIGLIIPFEKITAPATTAAIRQVTISTGLILLALAFLWFLAGQIVHPIRVLTDAAQAVAQGKWSVTAEVHSHDEAEVLANTFNLMTAQLQDLFGALEQRVAERTKALSNVAEISIATSSINDPQEMLETVVQQTQRKFGLYHAHVFLYDAERDELGIVACGWKEGDEHEGTHGTARIPFAQEQSLVARAARNRQAVIVNDVHSDPGWLPNPLLPDTASELAVPMFASDKLIGVLDVQSDRLNAFSQEDANIQTTLASQIAVAVQNARLYTQTETTRAETQRTANQLSEALKIAKLANWEYDVARDRFIFNDSFYSIFHTTAEQQGGYELSSAQYAERLVYPEDLPLVGTEIQKALTSTDRHYSAQLEHRILYADGGVGYISVEVHIERDSQGNILRYYGANQDITERKLLNDQLAQRARHQEALNLITQKIQSATTVESALQVAARELGHALGQKPTLVALDLDVLAGERKVKESAK